MQNMENAGKKMEFIQRLMDSGLLRFPFTTI